MVLAGGGYDGGGESSQVGGLVETQVESLSDYYEFMIEDDEVLDEAALAARYRPGGDPSAYLLRSM